MPVKWDSDKDKFILNCLLLDSSVVIGNAVVDNIIKSWPPEFGDAPTKKAISEHFLKIRKTHKKFAVGGGGDSVSTTPAATPKTPRTAKPRATPKKAVGLPKTPTSKRKRSIADRDSDVDDNEENDGGVVVSKIEVDGLNGMQDDAEESPSKRARTVVKYESEDDDGALNSDSEFNAEEA